jgi:hypothetical protein
MVKHGFIGIALLCILGAFAGACIQIMPAPVPTPTPAPTPVPVVTYPVPELKYILLANFLNVFYVDPDFYPIARQGQEEKSAVERYLTIRASYDEFEAIVKHLGLPLKTDYNDAEKLLIYREYKKLNLGVEISGSGDPYRFVLRVGDNQGERIEGTITRSGQITVLKREPSFNTRPICLSKGTLIDTPGGPVPVEQVLQGMAVWTVDASGKRSPASVINTRIIPLPPTIMLVRVELNDGRTVTASPGHMSADGLALGDYKVGDTLDRGTVISTDYVTDDGLATYDLLPDGQTGLYWANGILLKSTLAGK